MKLAIKYTIGIFCLLPSLSCLAFSLKHGKVPVQLGVFTSSQGKNQNINIQGLIGNQYTVDNNKSTNGLFGIGYYVDGLDKEHFQLSYGVNGFYFGKTSINGTVIQEHLFTNLSYKYDINHVPIYFAAKSTVKNNNEAYAITFDAGIGPNFIQTSNYSETPLDSFTVPDNAFSSHNNVTFTAMAGVGLKLNNIFGRAPLECGYRFFYLGQGDLSKNTDQLLNTLKTGNNYANALMCSVTV